MVKRNTTIESNRKIALFVARKKVILWQFIIAVLKLSAVEKGNQPFAAAYRNGERLKNEYDGSHAHIPLIMRSIEQDRTWGAKSEKKYILAENEVLLFRFTTSAHPVMSTM